jgi:hypothetical protein
MRAGTGFRYDTGSARGLVTGRCEGCGQRLPAAQLRLHVIQEVSLLDLWEGIEAVAAVERLQIAQRDPILACSLACVSLTIRRVGAQAGRMLADCAHYPAGFAVLLPRPRRSRDPATRRRA